MQVHDAKLVISAAEPHQYPSSDLAEVALSGRSNVGKSSFINKMIQRKGLARTSSQPGKTQTLNFYEINEAFRFVDVPGYGYAKVSKKDRVKWAKMIEKYLTTRDNLELLLLLMDFRHAPTALDIEMKNYAESLDIPYAIVLTKMDKIKRSQYPKHLSIYKKALDLPTVDALFPVSSATGEGLKDVWSIVEEFI